MPVPALPTFPKVTAQTITSFGNTPKMNASLTGCFIKVLEKMQLFKKYGAGFWSLLLLGMAVNAMVNTSRFRMAPMPFVVVGPSLF